VEALVVERGEVLDDRELELGAGAPDAVADQLGLEAVDEALRERVVVAIADRADRGEHAAVVEDLAVVRALQQLHRIIPPSRHHRSISFRQDRPGSQVSVKPGMAHSLH
jgi:hypothetical protein